MGVTITILTVLLAIDCFLLIGIILLQRGKGQGLAGAFGVGGMEEALGTHAASTAQKITAVLGVLFLLLSVTVAFLRQHHEAGTMAKPAAASADKGESPKGAPATKGDAK